MVSEAKCNSLYRVKEITKKLYNNIMNSIFINSGKTETSDPHRLLLNLSDNTNLKRSDKYVTL